MEHLLTAFVTDSTRFLDPTCGSGVAIKIAKRLGAHSALGLELDGDFAVLAQAALRSEAGEVEMSEDPLDRPATPEEIEMVERMLKRAGPQRAGAPPVAHLRS